MTDPQFTDAELAAGVHAAMRGPGNPVLSTSDIYAILRAVGAVPARMLEGAEPGETFVRGTWIRGQGSGGRTWDGEVLDSRPLTTQIRTADLKERLVWTGSAHSHERPPVDQAVDRAWREIL